ncbi:ribulose-phosphate 3-epimerase [Carboxydochorda subterranea]|uniref:Ribulose-phosphate 3-epimerase n=1 Tax=Carboxydichorda subterranea TaxID=3109565 RepID=A0ABZ1C0P6_9FIRM|nr:ribulose-phosphate 3-epimerase [Limnochorda sp. L945t]WRP18405.1 ribulose-phosphate 3-epimerase [Limnochorda sp. L945t]
MTPPLPRVRIAPSLLAADFARLADSVSRVPNADWLHVDVMDGHFVPNLTVGPVVVAALRHVTSLPLDVHLMVESPESMVEAFARAGANHLTVHVEATHHLDRLLRHIRELGLRAGVALNPGTPVEALDYVVELADLVLVMTVNPGFGGQHFIPQMVRKVEAVRRLLEERQLSCDVEVDGGVDDKTAPALVQAGATVLVAGTFVFKDDDPAGAVTRLRRVSGAVAGFPAAGPEAGGSGRAGA